MAELTEKEMLEIMTSQIPVYVELYEGISAVIILLMSVADEKGTKSIYLTEEEMRGRDSKAKVPLAEKFKRLKGAFQQEFIKTANELKHEPSRRDAIAKIENTQFTLSSMLSLCNYLGQRVVQCKAYIALHGKS